MPLIPAIRPLNSINITAEMPISMPPIVEASGVNSVAIATAYSQRGKGSIQSDQVGSRVVMGRLLVRSEFVAC